MTFLSYTTGIKQSNFTNENNLPTTTKWIAFGCSYAGTLVAWLRLKYPDKIHGAISSSAPLEAKLYNTEYHEMVKKAMNDFDVNSNTKGDIKDTIDDNKLNCIEEAKKSLQAFEALNTNEQKILLDQHFDNDTKTRIGLDIRGTTYTIFRRATQYNTKTSTNPSFNIQLACQIMVNLTLGEPMNRMFELLKVAYQHESTYTTFSTLGWKEWTYQNCNEFGWSAATSVCQNYFGQKYTKEFIMERVIKTNSEFGGKVLNVTNVVFVHGSMDPGFP